MAPEAPPLTHRQRLVHEVQAYAAIALYLFICLGALLLYKSAVMEAHGLGHVPFGLAAVKALILAKFILIAQGLRLGERHHGRAPIVNVLYKSLVFLAMLIVLSLVEEMLAGAIHGRTLAQSLAGIADGNWLELLAASLLMWLILLPYFGYAEVSRALGEGGLRRLLLGTPR
jgi:hypothetical protein